MSWQEQAAAAGANVQYERGCFICRRVKGEVDRPVRFRLELWHVARRPG